MIILKLAIKGINLRDLSDCGKIRLEELRIKKRDFLGEFKEENLKLIKDVQQHCYDENGNNIKIESIIGECALPVFLDDEDKPKYTPVKIKREELENYVRELQNEIDKIENEIKQEKNQEFNRELRSRIEDLKTWRDKLKKLLGQNPNSDTITIEKEYTRLGYYTREGENHNPEIVLFMGAIGDDKQLLVSTYVHEMFHAYYDLCWIKDQNNPKYKNKVDLTYIEEPLTEYAMLKFLESFGNNDVDVHEVAKSVRKMQFSPGTCHYGFGYYLWKWEKEGNEPLCNWINCYKEAKFNISNEEKEMFAKPFSKGLYPFGNENYYMRLLWAILTGVEIEQQDGIHPSGGNIINKRKKSRLFEQYL